MFIDTHAHLVYPDYKDDQGDVIARARQAGLEAIINIALLEEMDQFKPSLSLAEKHEGFIYNSIGVHPHDALKWNESTFAELKTLSGHKSAVAIGEIGLDYHYMHSPKDVQQKVFRKLLSLCRELDMPAVVHSREAAEDTIKILSEENKGDLRGVFHCFSGDIPFAKKVLDMGFLLSFTGVVTFPKAVSAREVVKWAPLDRMMIETDCPFLAPQEFRGKRNEPSYVTRVADKIAEVKGLPVEEIASVTTKNARQMFAL